MTARTGQQAAQAAAEPRCPKCQGSFETCTCTGVLPKVRRMLGQMADRLEANRPDQPITTIGRHALIQATTMDPALTPTLRRHVPDITGSVVRRTYAARLRQIAEGM